METPKQIKITDLPQHDFCYRPPRPTFILVKRYDWDHFVEERFDLQYPLRLKVGDTVQFQDSVPEQFTELTRTNTGHGVYAIFQKPQQTIEQNIAESPAVDSDITESTDETTGKRKRGSRPAKTPVCFIGESTGYLRNS